MDTLAPILIVTPSDEANQAHNILGIIATSIGYLRKYSVAFPKPDRPQPYPNMADDSTNLVRARGEAKHKALTVEYELYRAAMRGTTEFLLHVIEETW